MSKHARARASFSTSRCVALDMAAALGGCSGLEVVQENAIYGGVVGGLQTLIDAREDQLTHQKAFDEVAIELAAAVRRQAQAAADIDTTYGGEIERFVAQRLRVVEGTETVVNVIGRQSP